jgi:hypothetical protein
MFKIICLGLLICLACDAVPTLAQETGWRIQAYAPAPLDNPLKGLVPYAKPHQNGEFPYSMEFSYFPLSAVLKAPDTYDWGVLDQFLDAVAARGHQAIFRFYTEYPGRTDGLPAFLLGQGVSVVTWSRASTPPRPPVDNHTPDYANGRLQETLLAFIAALGARYDADPRIGFITAGMLGLWGEWHDYPRQALFADRNFQQAVMDAYSGAFHVTPILLRYPAGQGDSMYAANATAAFGYHDDSFAWSTLPTRETHFLSLLQKAGAEAKDKWQRYPIGGEIRPEAWGKVFDAVPDDVRIEDFGACVEATHVTWLMDSGMFRDGNPEARLSHAQALVSRMGYEFHVAKVAVQINDGKAQVRVQIENRGVAPFYYAWPLRFALLDASGKLVSEARSTASLIGILPLAGMVERDQTLVVNGLPEGVYRIVMQVPNPLPLGHPVRFANALQDADLPGWVTLGNLKIPS